MSDPGAPQARPRPAPPSLRNLTRSWFLFLGACRRRSTALDPDTRWMRNRLEDMLTNMERKAQQDAHVEVLWHEIKPVLVYLADEILLTCDWAGEDAWADDLLETAHFGTQHAGEDLFVRLERAREANRPEVLEIFFKALCLGFKGRYLKQEDELASMRRDLYRRLPTERLAGNRFCPEAYEATDERRFVKLPVVAVARVVIGLIAFLIVIYVFAGESFKNSVEDLNQLTTDYLGPDAEPVDEGD